MILSLSLPHIHRIAPWPRQQWKSRADMIIIMEKLECTEFLEHLVEQEVRLGLN